MQNGPLPTQTGVSSTKFLLWEHLELSSSSMCAGRGLQTALLLAGFVIDVLRLGGLVTDVV